MISIGMDVGQKQDHAALGVLQKNGLRPESHRPHWDVLTLANIPLGTPYQQLASAVANLGMDYQRSGYPTVVTIDASGVGAAVLELARAEAPDLHIVGVTISGGRVLEDHGLDNVVVGKHRLTEVLQVALEQHGITFLDPDDARLFKPQAENFVAKPNTNGYLRHEAKTGHDDLVLTLELALWTGDTMHDQQAGVTTP